MPNQSFTIYVRGLKPEALTEAVANDLFEAGLDDGTPGTRNGFVCIDIDRQAGDLFEAMESAVSQVERTLTNVRAIAYQGEKVVRKLSFNARGEPVKELIQERLTIEEVLS
jgi:hypothetical protein